MRVNTGPVARTDKSKSCRPTPSSTCRCHVGTARVCRRSVQYVARQETAELTPRNGQRLNGTRTVGAKSNLVSP